MNLEFFIAKRFISSKSYKSSVSLPIIKIAVSAIAIGIIMMIIAIATGIGLQQKIRQKIAAFSGHVIISNFDDNQTQITKTPININQKFYPKFKNVNGVTHIQAVATKAGIIRTENSFEGIVIKGVGKDYNFSLLQEYLTEGKLPNIKNDLNNEVLISSYLANRLQLKLGDKFLTFFMKEEGKMPNKRVFKIVGIYNSGFQEFDASYLIADIRHIQRMNKWQENEVGAFEVFLNDFNKIDEKGKEIYKAIPSTLNSVTISEKYYSIFEWLKLFDFNIMVILIVMIAVASINMIVALLVLILERTATVGILKSLGATNWSIRKIFLYNAAYLVFRGLLLGNIIALIILFVQYYFKIIKLNPQNYYVSVAPISFSWSYFLAVNVLSLIICMIVLIIPSYIVTKISPLKAMRF